MEALAGGARVWACDTACKNRKGLLAARPNGAGGDGAKTGLVPPAFRQERAVGLQVLLQLQYGAISTAVGWPLSGEMNRLSDKRPCGRPIASG